MRSAHLVFFLFLVAGCTVMSSGCSQKPSPSATEDAQTHPKQDTVHTAKNSLDYAGTYQTQEGASDDIKSLTLTAPGMYTLKLHNNRQDSGAYRWNDKGMVISIERQGKELLQFFIAEGMIRLTNTSAEGRVFYKIPE